MTKNKILISEKNRDSVSFAITCVFYLVLFVLFGVPALMKLPALGPAGQKCVAFCDSDSMFKEINAREIDGNLIKAIAGLVGGGGGGRPNMAQAGGKNPEGIADVIAKAPEVLEGQLQ